MLCRRGHGYAASAALPLTLILTLPQGMFAVGPVPWTFMAAALTAAFVALLAVKTLTLTLTPNLIMRYIVSDETQQTVAQLIDS